MQRFMHRVFLQRYCMPLSIALALDIILCLAVNLHV